MNSGSKIIVAVEPVCLRTPFTSSHIPRSSTSPISSLVTRYGPAGLNVSADFPFDDWPPRSIWKDRSLTSLTTQYRKTAPRSAEERLVEIRDDIGQVDAAVVVNADDRFFGTWRTDAHQEH